MTHHGTAIHEALSPLPRCRVTLTTRAGRVVHRELVAVRSARHRPTWTGRGTPLLVLSAN